MNLIKRLFYKRFVSPYQDMELKIEELDRLKSYIERTTKKQC